MGNYGQGHSANAPNHDIWQNICPKEFYFDMYPINHGEQNRSMAFIFKAKGQGQSSNAPKLGYIPLGNGISCRKLI